MLARTVVTVLVVVAVAFGAVGLVAIPPGALAGWVFLAGAVGLVAWQGAGHLPENRFVTRPRWPAWWSGIAAAALCLTFCLAVTGLIAVAGAATAVSSTLLLLAVAAWAGWRSTAAKAPPAPDEAPPVRYPVVLPPLVAADLATDELCVAWRRSYLELLRAVDEPSRQRVVRQRQEYLDELERRDSLGFARWLDSGARAGSDPRRFLTSGG
ncbi:hypothetical protein [Amycolatopsis saalfeldensis]|uniref:Uncharacterized protein n=1 Tax=Amycolatopsis saalfeldensis TaxID=394193 RepID=A0A1H8UW80_9PSEU|nr:hypothetical protein [Amycolatopsis saalfeldensis]SEP07411.1 hypothetical protein SAMN04489732_103499 [Amycolatopsis saalfeldensis]